MALKSYRPITPSNRYKLLPDFEEVTASSPEKSLCRPLKKSGGRNNNGRITCRHRGGGHKRRYRLIDFKRSRRGDIAKVISIEYDPNRTARIALIEYGDGQRSYIIAPRGLEVDAQVSAGEGAPIKPGCALRAEDVLASLERVRGSVKILAVLGVDDALDRVGQLLGILTERDCMRVAVQSEYYNMPQDLVRDRMTTDPVSVSPDDNIFDLARRFIESKYRRYPVVENGKVVGLISRRDVMGALGQIYTS